jgi:steroid delta-isomerase-like uncharacterized protein
MATPTELARRWFQEVWNDRREATVDELMAERLEGHMESADVNRRAEFKEQWRVLLEAFPDLAVTVEDTVAQRDQVVVRWSVVGTHRGASLGIAPTKRKVAFRGMTWLEWSNNQIVRGWDSWNLGALLETLRQAASSEQIDESVRLS